MASTCWSPGQNPDQEWTDQPPTPPTTVVDESSIACIAVACFAIACWPAPVGDWIDDGRTPVYVCGEWPPNTPPSGGGGGEVVPVLRAFSNGFSVGFN